MLFGVFNIREAKLKQKREKIKAAKRAIPRDIEFVCFKNRYGESNYLKYYAHFDYFIPVDILRFIFMLLHEGKLWTFDAA
mgnify:CR=1 FL=1